MAVPYVYKPTTTVDWTSRESSQQFSRWKKEVLRIVDGPLSEQTDEMKLNTVYIWAGAEAELLVEAKQAEDPTLKVETVNQLLATLAKCITHKTHFREAREDFYNACQKPGENATSFYSRLLELHRHAEFGEGTDFLIVDKLINGCLNNECKKKLMIKDKTVKVTDCLSLLRDYESVDVTMKKFADVQVHATYSHDPSKRSQQKGARQKTKPSTRSPSASNTDNSSRQACKWCSGPRHSRSDCPASGAKCDFCSKKGHFEKACIFKQKTTSTSYRNNAVDLAEESDDDLDFLTVSNKALTSDKDQSEVVTDVLFHAPVPTTMTGKVDCGAQATAMPVSFLDRLGLKRTDLQASRVRITGASGHNMKCIGTLTISAEVNNIRRDTTVYVTELGSELLLGFGFMEQFKLADYAKCVRVRNLTVTVGAVHITDESEMDYQAMKSKWHKHLPLGNKTGDPLKDLMLAFPDSFDGSVGEFEEELELKLVEDAKPVQLPPRAVPQSVIPKLKAELDKMEEQGIIRPCPETTDWVHNLVLACKKNGDLRICLDPKNLNRALIRNVHYTASWEDAQHSFVNGRIFSTLDAKSGYWTQKLSKTSEPLTAFNTPFRKYCFKRMPFGLSVSAEVFQAKMDEALDGIPGTYPCADDVKIQGSNHERHDIHLLETVERASRAGIKFNPDKCTVKKPQVEYFGRLISANGVTPCPDKVLALLKMSHPESKQELQSYLGTVNFMSTFIPNLAQKTFTMRGLLKNGVQYLWTSDMQKEFKSVQQAIADVTQMRHFDPRLPVILETDASLKGLGAVLIQDGCPVRFLSKSLTPAESNYSNIERELLAVLHACEKLHVYTFGRPVCIHTDHKPLESIFLKPVSLAPPRLKRMLLRLSMYDVRVTYVGAKKVLLADTLSRLLPAGRDERVPGLDITIASVIKLRQTRLASLQDETKSDPVLQPLQRFINLGWPESMQDLPEPLRAFWCFRDELAIHDGVIVKGNRIITPSSLRSECLEKLHDGHQGLSSTLQRARRSVYWPRMQDDIENMIQNCDQCQIHGNKKSKVPQRQISASRPMEILGADIMDFKGRPVLVQIDYYSGYILVDPLSSQTSSAVAARINDNARRFGLPDRIITDNGPCFRSEKFESFCNELGTHHDTTSPHYHQSNGRVERAIQTVRKIFSKTENDVQVTHALNAYHDTPIAADLPSPAELFLLRRITTRLTARQESPPLNDEQRERLADKRAAHLKPQTHKIVYTPNQPVWYSEDGTADWKPGVIDNKDLHPNSYWIVSERNTRLRRNGSDIKPRTSPSTGPSLPQMHIAPEEESGQARPETPPPEGLPDHCEAESSVKTPEIQTASAPSPERQNPTPALRRSARSKKTTKQPEFVYQKP